MSHDWKNVLIRPEQSIREALTLINDEALRVALVVDEEERLLGIVSDGDVRRGLLNNLTLDDEVAEVMNRSPISAASSLSRSELIELMSSNDIVAVPLVENGKIVGIETVTHALETPRIENPVFLMAGGLGTRLKPLTDDCPKPMLTLGDKPILETVLQRLVDAGFVNFYISTHYLPERIRDYFGDGSQWDVSIAYVHEESPLGTAGALGLLPEDMPELPILMMNGDILTKVDFQRLLEFHNANRSTVTMCVREYEYQIPYGVVEGDHKHVIKMIEKPIHRTFVNAGIYVVDCRIARAIPKNHVVDMPALLESRISFGDSVLMFPVHEFWLDVGRLDDFERAKTDIHSLAVR